MRFALFGYFCALVFIGLSFSPETQAHCCVSDSRLPQELLQVSTGVHQEFGPCNATDVDLLGLERKP